MNFRFNALLAAAIFSSATAFAGPKEDVLHDFSQCAEIRDGASRLACFDSLTPRVKALVPRPAVPSPNAPVSAAPPPPVAAAPAMPQQQTTPEQFGSDRLPQESQESENAPKELDHITSGVSEVAFTPFGKFIVFLDNGQIWRQLQGDSGHAHFRKKATDNKVTISRGLLGSYNLTVNDSNAVFKVTRVK
jgi:hypothetical protein